jgi:hypothetical protein
MACSEQGKTIALTMSDEMAEVTKSSGEKVQFSKDKLRASLLRSGADEHTVAQIMNRVRDDLYQGIPTREIYNRAFAMLKKKKRHFAARYSLKKAIYDLGPTGFPFEQFVGALMSEMGYRVDVGIEVPGACVSHEVDVMAYKGKTVTLVECKFHGEATLYCNVKVPLYIHSRFNDIKAHWNSAHRKSKASLQPGWVVTNTRFSEDAQQYGTCVGLYLMGWDSPDGASLKARIDALGLYPITVSTLLTKSEKQQLLDRQIVLCKQLIARSDVLEKLGISENRSPKIIAELSDLCTITSNERKS